MRPVPKSKTDRSDNMTRIEKIRQMTDEELAEFLFRLPP